MEKRTRWTTWQTTAALLGAISMTGGCAASPEPQTAPPRSEPAVAAASDTLPDEVVAEAAASQGLDVDSVVVAKHETERRIEELDPATQREFSAMFGTDPLGLASHPDNARKYDIPLEMNERVEAWIDYFENRIPERFRLYLERKGRYEEMILAKLRVAGLPEDLLYLSLIESGMNANAYSRARAVGLWQFIRGTARMYGLETSYWVDERRDPEKATDAAIRFLSDLYDEFGSWYLAAAGYNGGPGRVRRGIARTGSDDFWVMSHTLRRETRNYVPKLIAAAIIGHDPERYGFSGIAKTNPEEYEIVEVPDATSFDVLAEAAGTDEQTLRLLNAQYLRGVTPPDRRVELKIPRGNGQRFVVAYAAIPPEERVTWTMHTPVPARRPPASSGPRGRSRSR